MSKILKKIIKFIGIFSDFHKYAQYDTRLRNGRIFGRPWSPLKFSGRFFSFWFGKYNYNNIMFQTKSIAGGKDIVLSDSGTFNFSRYAEKKLLLKIVELLRLPFLPFSGYITTGATEANIYALWVAREWSRKTQGDKIYWIIPNNAHYSAEKALQLFDIRSDAKHKVISIESDSLGRAKKQDIVENIRKIRFAGNDPIVLFLTVMTVECGAIDPIKEIDDFITQSGIKNVFFHLDAAFSGFLLPFIEKYQDIFHLKSLYSISIDFSKTIGGPMGSGAVILRGGLEDYVRIQASYLSEQADRTLTGSRRGLDAVSLYALFSVNDYDQIRMDVLRTLEKTKFLTKELSNISYISLFCDPDLNYIVFSLAHSAPEKDKKIRNTLKSYAVSSSIVRIGNQEEELFKIIIRSSHSYSQIRKFVHSLKSII